MIRAAVNNFSRYSRSYRPRSGFANPRFNPDGPSSPGVAYKPLYDVAGGVPGSQALGGVQSFNEQVKAPKTDSLYDNDLSRIGRDFNTGMAGLTDEENRLGLRYGIQFDRENADFNGDGVPDAQRMTNFRIADNVDVSNPFSMAALLKRSFTQAQRGNTNSYAARGQLYSGALQRAQEGATFNFQEGQNSLLNSFGDNARDLFSRRYGLFSDAERFRGEAAAALAGRNTDAGPQPLQAAPPQAATDPAAAQGYTGQQILAGLGGTLVIKGNKRFIRKPDGTLIPL